MKRNSMVNRSGKPAFRGFGFALRCLGLTARVCGEAPEGQTSRHFPGLHDHGPSGTASLGHALASAHLADQCAICFQRPWLLLFHTRYVVP